MYVAQPPAESIEEPVQSVSAPSEETPPPISDPVPPPTSLPSQAQCPDMASDPSPPPVCLSQLEELSTGQAEVENGTEGSVWKVAAPSAKAEAAVYIPLAVMTLESMLDPTELSTVSAERHRPGSGLPPKQSQSQKPPGEAGLPPPSSFLSASRAYMCVRDDGGEQVSTASREQEGPVFSESCHSCSSFYFGLIKCPLHHSNDLTVFEPMGSH